MADRIVNKLLQSHDSADVSEKRKKEYGTNEYQIQLDTRQFIDAKVEGEGKIGKWTKQKEASPRRVEH